MRKKLIVLDLDGTLLTDNKEIDVTTKEYLKELLQRGHFIVFASGRRFENMSRYINEVFAQRLDNMYAVCCDGCYICNGYGKIIEHFDLISGEELLYIYNIVQQEKCRFNFYTAETDYFVFRGISELKNLLKIILKRIRKDRKDRKEKVILPWCLTKYDAVEKVVLIKKKFSFSFAVKDRLSTCFSFREMNKKRLEVQKKGVNKLSAIDNIREKMGFEWSDVIFLGDDVNDYCMFQSGCFFIAMGNAEITIRKNANYVTDTNNNQGVLKALKMIFSDIV